MAEAREQDTGMDMIPGYERPTRSAVVDTAEQNVTPCCKQTGLSDRLGNFRPNFGTSSAGETTVLIR